jgi:hypothetical protein
VPGLQAEGVAPVNEAAAFPHHGKFLHPHRLFTLFKYAIYLLLAWNAFLFFQEDFAASAETFSNALHWRNVVKAFTASIDTTAWLVLLLLFELETAVIPDDRLQGGLKWFLMAIRVICYTFIVYAFYGYVYKYGVITSYAPIHIADVCSLAGSEWNYVISLDDYPPIDAASCASLQGQQLFMVSGTDIIGTRAALDTAWGLAVIDIVNAATWLIIVVLLETEVWLQLKDLLSGAMLKVNKYLKVVFYGLLFVCAIAWGFEGSFLDFWDAFLWLVAFIFIEMNIFQWHGEVEEAEELELATRTRAPTR